MAEPYQNGKPLTQLQKNGHIWKTISKRAKKSHFRAISKRAGFHITAVCPPIHAYKIARIYLRNSKNASWFIGCGCLLLLVTSHHVFYLGLSKMFRPKTFVMLLTNKTWYILYRTFKEKTNNKNGTTARRCLLLRDDTPWPPGFS